MQGEKRVTERNTLPSNISWKNEKDVEAHKNNQLKMYLKEHGLKISGSKAELTERVLSHARGNATRASDVLEAEEFNDSCKESESELSDSDGENTYVEESFEILFVPEEDINT